MIDDDRDRAHTRVQTGLRRIYGEMKGIDAVPCRVLRKRWRQACVRWPTPARKMILLNPVGKDVAEDREQMERLAAEVIPQLT